MPKPAIDKVVLNPKDPILDVVTAAIRPALSSTTPAPTIRVAAVIAVSTLIDQGWTPPTPEQAAHIATEDARVAAEIEEARRG